MPTPVGAYLWPLSYVIHADDSQTPKKTYLFCPCLIWQSDVFLRVIEIEWVAWCFNQKISMLGRFSQMRGSPALNCWPVACDNDLAMGLGFVIHVSKIGCVNIPGTYSHYPYAFHVFIPTGASSFIMFRPWTLPSTMSLGYCIELHQCSQDAFPISRFTISVWPCCLARSKGVSPGNHSWHSNWTCPISHFNWSPYGLQNLTSGVKNMQKPLF